MKLLFKSVEEYREGAREARRGSSKAKRAAAEGASVEIDWDDEKEKIYKELIAKGRVILCQVAHPAADRFIRHRDSSLGK